LQPSVTAWRFRAAAGYRSHFTRRAEADCLRPPPPAAVLRNDADPLLRDDFEWLTKSIVAFRNGACSSI
jgi:hypothetical protein